MNSEAGRWIKVLHAADLLQQLRAQINSTPMEDFSTYLRSFLDPAEEQWVCSLDDFEPMEMLSVGALIGDILHNLRSALDYLIWDLAILDGGIWPMSGDAPSRTTQFPICSSEEEWTDKRTQTKLLMNVSDNHKGSLLTFQPFRSDDQRLATLRELSNQDKHRIIHPIRTSLGPMVPWVRRTEDCDVADRTKDFPVRLPIVETPPRRGTEVLRIPLVGIGRKPHVDLFFEGVVGFAFNNGEPVTRTLFECRDIVEEILKVFEAELSSEEAISLRAVADLEHRPADLWSH